METQQLVPSVLFPSYKMFRSAVNNIDILRSFMYSARHYCPILTKSGVSQRIFVKFPSIECYENLPSRSRADTCGQTDRRADRET
jgi:hypothetical protein